MAGGAVRDGRGGSYRSACGAICILHPPMPAAVCAALHVSFIHPCLQQRVQPLERLGIVLAVGLEVLRDGVVLGADLPPRGGPRWWHSPHVAVAGGLRVRQGAAATSLIFASISGIIWAHGYLTRREAASREVAVGSLVAGQCVTCTCRSARPPSAPPPAQPGSSRFRQS